MARPVHPALPLLILAASLLVQAANCSRPSPEEPQAQAAAVPRPAIPRDESQNKGTGLAAAAAVVTADEGRIRADDDAATSSATTSLVRGRDGSVPGGNWSAALLRSKLARLFLAGAGVVVEDVDSAVGPSCRSNDAHNKSCPPASKG